MNARDVSEIGTMGELKGDQTKNTKGQCMYITLSLRKVTEASYIYYNSPD